MTASDLTPAQLEAAEKFLRDIAKTQPGNGDMASVEWKTFVLILAWYGELCRQGPGRIVVIRNSGS